MRARFTRREEYEISRSDLPFAFRRAQNPFAADDEEGFLVFQVIVVWKVSFFRREPVDRACALFCFTVWDKVLTVIFVFRVCVAVLPLGVIRVGTNDFVYYVSSI